MNNKFLSETKESAGSVRNIMLTGFWNPTGQMIAPFSNDTYLNPGGWKGRNWESRGYNIYSFFPKPGTYNGTFEVDYQNTWNDFWNITAWLKPVAIISFGAGNGPWEIEYNARNLDTWVNDYKPPYQPTPCPPDNTRHAGYVRHSTLPVQAIADAVNAQTTVNAWVDWNGNPGAFLCEYIAYLGMWYQDLHNSTSDAAQCVAAGFIHVSSSVSVQDAMEATNVTLRETIKYIQSVLRPPHSPIRINSDAEFTPENGVLGGSGTTHDPYFIGYWVIDATGAGNAIYIGNTTAYFVIQNCTLQNATYHAPRYFCGAGITLYNVQRGVITSNTITHNGYGIELSLSHKVTVSNNSILFNSYGIYLLQSGQNAVTNNNISSNNFDGVALYNSGSCLISSNELRSNSRAGINADSSTFNTQISSNNISNNSNGIRLNFSCYATIASNYIWSNELGIRLNHNADLNNITDNIISVNRIGIMLEYSNSNFIFNNTVASNTEYGILLERSNTNTMSYNNLTANRHYGIIINNSAGNFVHHNNFRDNNAGLPQASENSPHPERNHWNVSGAGNYWSDWNSPDNDHDGIVDRPYVLHGFAGARDYYPLVIPVNMPLIEYKLTLHKGWNFVSIPIFPQSNRIEAVLSTIAGHYTAVRYFDSMTDEWKTYIPGVPSHLNTLCNLDATMGFWLHTTTGIVLNVMGTVPVRTQISLKAGWNMVGYPTNAATRTLAQVFADAPAGLIVQTYSPIDKYNLMTLYLNDFMKPRSGYWVYIPTDWIWVVDW